ncbi:MAG: recombinase family protein [bacterium]|nr:recombinase family protein [bacterium]
MMRDESGKVEARHREREAWIYVRQSTLHQVEHHQESRRRQYALVDRAKMLGWRREQVVVVDEDQGVSGSTPEHRRGFRRLVSAVGRGGVGLVMGVDLSRFARNSPDWHLLMYLCRFTQTLIADERGIYDPESSTDRLVLGVRGQMSEVEVDTMVQRMAIARSNKAQRGELVGILPAGYETDEEGRIVLTSNERVATTIRAVFQKLEELGSTRAVSGWMRARGMQYPVRRKELRGHPVVWVDPTPPRVRRTVKHPIYAGAYVYGRTQSVRVVEAGPGQRPSVRVRKRVRNEYPVLLRDHHEGYISFEVHERIMAKLAERSAATRERNDDHRGAVREGPALLQGLVRCGDCGRRMYVLYGGRRGRTTGSRTITYQCKGGPGMGMCQAAGGKRIEQVVVAEFLKVTQPASVDALVLAEEAARREEEEMAKRWKLRVEHAQYEASLAQRRYDAVDPDNRVVARDLERRWNERLVELEEVQARALASKHEHQALTQEELGEARRLAKDLERVWDAPTTAVVDRKALLRTVIEEVQVRTEKESVKIRVVWKGGACTDSKLERHPRRPVHATPEDTVELIRKLALELDDAQIARVLNKQGRRSPMGNPYGREAVRCLRRKNSIARCPAPQARDPREGPFTADEAAVELGVTNSTVHRWLREGLLPGRQATPGAPWRIVLTEDLRRRLGGGDAPEGWVGLGAAAKRLGLTKSHVAYLVKSGKLPAVRTRVGKREGWKIDVSSVEGTIQREMFDPVTNEREKES